ncbi:aminotransferase class V-fold PLP-dependent enzyme [Inquilinus sp. CAU 1745]|uniref:aminotransferase class V-fold PLP-dependent enzyme n=1 Tax=Inquilinus sp. CAU 1745 TaxID=3140369 RepID=UPI00325B3B53
MLRLKSHFSCFLNAAPGRLHAAAHSHHLWPDVTRAAQSAAWEQAAVLADDKWSTIFGEVVPQAQRHIARILNVGDPNAIVFAPNTHDLVRRLFSCLPATSAPRVLTTDSEFHSFTRQAARLEEEGALEVERISTEPFDTFEDRFAEAASRGGHDLIFFSQVFFNSGFAIGDLERMVKAAPDPATLVAIDGYHGFMAMPTDISALSSRAFYIAGGYKYAMAGEGACFMACPPGYGARPRDTGWYADFFALSQRQSGVGYASDAMRFMGATFDPVGLYRLNAVMGWLQGLGVSVADIHAHAHALQGLFVEGLRTRSVAALDPGLLMVPLDEPRRGNFLTFRTDRAAELHRILSEARVVTDVRGDRLRVGFGLYHEARDIDLLLDAVAAALA